MLENWGREALITIITIQLLLLKQAGTMPSKAKVRLIHLRIIILLIVSDQFEDLVYAGATTFTNPRGNVRTVCYLAAEIMSVSCLECALLTNLMYLNN